MSSFREFWFSLRLRAHHALTAFLRCACAVCLICAHATRDSWEAKVSAEVNEMLKKFGLCMHFEKEGPFNQVHAKFVWL